jgi:hypothetical protein
MNVYDIDAGSLEAASDAPEIGDAPGHRDELDRQRRIAA